MAVYRDNAGLILGAYIAAVLGWLIKSVLPTRRIPLVGPTMYERFYDHSLGTLLFFGLWVAVSVEVITNRHERVLILFALMSIGVAAGARRLLVIRKMTKRINAPANAHLHGRPITPAHACELWFEKFIVSIFSFIGYFTIIPVFATIRAA